MNQLLRFQQELKNVTIHNIKQMAIAEVHRADKNSEELLDFLLDELIDRLPQPQFVAFVDVLLNQCLETHFSDRVIQ